MKWLLFFCVLIISSGLVNGTSCVTYRDCPAPDCVGSARVCDENLCRPTPCIIPAESDIKREDVQSFEDAVRPYEQGINLSIKTRNPTAVKNTIMGSLGLQQMLMLLLKAIGVFIIGLIAALLVVLAWSHGLGRIIIIIVFVLLVAGVVIVVFGKDLFFPQARSWDHATVKDLVPKGFTSEEVSVLQQKFISESLVDAAQGMSSTANGESNIVVLENEDTYSLRGMRLKLDQGDMIRVAGEEVMRQDYGSQERILMDEDRFVFIITGPREDIYDIANSVLAQYPKPPTASRLFIADRSPPDITIVSPRYDQLTNDATILFQVSDNETGIDTIEVKDLDGFSGDRCTRKMGTATCSFIALHLRQGQNVFEIQAIDLAGNLRKQSSAFTFDDTHVEGVLISPTITRSNRVTFRLSDQTAGIDPLQISTEGLTASDCNASLLSMTCSFIAPLMEGDNTIIVTTEDNAGNADDLLFPIILDVTPPQIYIRDAEFDIQEAHNLASIRVNEKNYPISQCSKSGESYSCPYSAAIRTILSEDVAGNVGSVSR
jgi:hypothetical protein